MKTLEIKTPCHEDWSKMQGDDKKRYCDSCSHHVEDFTDKSVEEIISILEKREGRTCGRLKRSQLNPIKKIAATVMLGGLLAGSCTPDVEEVNIDIPNCEEVAITENKNIIPIQEKKCSASNPPIILGDIDVITGIIGYPMNMEHDPIFNDDLINSDWRHELIKPQKDKE